MSRNITGKNNPRWNNGASEYPNHHILKENRIIVLKEAKGKCEICGERARIVHHIDGSTDNHHLSNLIALCGSCHKATHSQETGDSLKTSKYIRKYGMTLSQIADKFNTSPSTILYWLKNPERESEIISRMGIIND